MRKVKDRKAIGRDGIPNEVWRGRGDGKSAIGCGEGRDGRRPGRKER